MMIVRQADQISNLILNYKKIEPILRDTFIRVSTSASLHTFMCLRYRHSYYTNQITIASNLT